MAGQACQSRKSLDAGLRRHDGFLTGCAFNPEQSPGPEIQPRKYYEWDPDDREWIQV